MHLVVENKCVNSTCIYHSPWLCGHSVGLVFNCDSRVVYSFCIPPKDLGDPGSSRGTLERVRVDLTVYSMRILSLGDKTLHFVGCLFCHKRRSRILCPVRKDTKSMLHFLLFLSVTHNETLYLRFLS
jgi:hypothetical protein